MSNTKVNALRDCRALPSRRRRDSVGVFIAWRPGPPRDGESLRWECTDGRWVSVAPGHGASAGSLLVLDSSGRCESAESYEDAVALARSWCT